MSPIADERRESYEWGHAAGLSEFAIKMYDTFGTTSVTKVAASLSELEAIVRTLADIEPLVEQGEPIHGEWEECGSCGGRNISVGEPVEHRSVCPWRRAVEWVAAHPDNGEGAP